MTVYDPRGGGNVHIDRVLTNISLGYLNNAFVGDVLVPPVRVNKQSDLYYEFGYETWGQEPGSDLRAPGGEAMEIPGIQVSTSTYFCQEHAVSIGVVDEERENADPPLAPDQDGTELITARVLLGRELAIRDMVVTAANYAAGHTTTLGAGARWDTTDYATSDPITDWKTGKRQLHSAIFREPTLGIIPWQVMSFLEDHPDFIERIKYSMPGVLTSDIIGTIFGTSRLIVPGAGYNSANLGQAVSLGYIWQDDVLQAWVPDRAGLKIPAFAYEFVWPQGGQIQVVDRWRETPRKRDMLRVSRRYDLKLIAVNGSSQSIAGYLIKDTLT